jgi:ankyrin repeat protein
MSRASEDNRDSASLSLMRAASDGDVQAVRSLLAAGADVNATNQGGQTALMLAALMGNGELVAR